MPLTRRHFLQLAGIALASPYLTHLPILAASPESIRFSEPISITPVYGRTFASTPIYDAPDTNAALIKMLWGDTVAPIVDMQDGWYRLNDGYTPRQNMQPMILPAQPNSTLLDPPFWAEVSGAVAVIREWCAASAPLVTRVGHGGVLRVIDRLPAENGDDWYGLAESENGSRIGWSKASVWSAAQMRLLTQIDQAAPSLSLLVDQAAQAMEVRDADHPLLTAPISTGRNLPFGAYPITNRQMTLAQSDPFGTPYALTFSGDLHLTGAYWHNRFGASTPGAAIQVTTALARWLYSRAATVIVS